MGLLVAGLLAGACSGDDAGMTMTPVTPPCDVEVELGSGVREWQPVEDGDTLYLYRGPQGGWMLYLSVRARGMSPEDVGVSYREAFADTFEVFGEDQWRVRLPTDLGDGWYERVGIWGAVYDDYWTSSYLIRGKDAIVEAVITDNTTGCQAADGWIIHIHEDPGT